jgi:hypothetical protein
MVGEMSNGHLRKRGRARPVFLQFFVTMSIMLMLFGSMLLPSTHIGSQATPLMDVLASDRESSDLTPWVNTDFVFIWSPIDPLYEQEDNEEDYGWGMRNEAGQRNNDRMPGVNRYGDSPMSDMGVMAVSSYDWDNHIKMILRDGWIFTDSFKQDYPFNIIDFSLIQVYNGVDLREIKSTEWPINVDCDANENAYHQTYTCSKCYMFDLDPAVELNEVVLQLPSDGIVKTVEKCNRNNDQVCEMLGVTGAGREGYQIETVTELGYTYQRMTVRAEPTYGKATAIEITWKDRMFTCCEQNEFRTIGKYPDIAPYSPHLQRVKDYVLWEDTISPSSGASRYDGRMLYTTRDLWLWGGTVEVVSTGRSMVLKSTMAEAWIDKNGNGIPDVADDCDGGYTLGQGWTSGNGGGDDCEVAHGIDNAWFANELSADAVWSWYGDEFFGFIHRDMMIASYDDNNKIEIVDMSDGDDTRTITLDAWENFMWVSSFVEDTWCGDDEAGDNYELQSYGYYSNVDWNNRTQAETAMNSPIIQRAIDSGNFESDWVLVKAEKPVTIYGGIWDNNWHMQVFGPRGSQYYIPFSVGITITGLDKEAHVNIDFQDTSAEDMEVTVAPGEQWTYCAMSCCPFSNNYVAELSWAEVRSDWPIRIELWQANDDNAFDNSQEASFVDGFDYYPADEQWTVAIHHRAIIYITALEEGTNVGWTGSWLEDKTVDRVLSKYQTYRIVMDSDEDYDGDNDDDTLADNEDELEGDIQVIHVSADKEVMVEVRYIRDYSCEPQDADLAMSINPTIQKASMQYPYFIPLMISTIMVTDLALVGTGRRGIAGVLGLVHRNFPMPKKIGK